jgi:hypothetical protein
MAERGLNVYDKRLVRLTGNRIGVVSSTTAKGALRASKRPG